MSAQDRGACYRLLSACYCLPEEDSVVADSIPEQITVFDVLSPAAGEHVRNMAAALSSETHDEITVEYSRLFVGPFKLPAPPYGSVYLDDGRSLMGDSTLDAARRYREAGVEMAPEQKDIPDHIGVELEFMAYLAYQEQAAASSGAHAEFAEALERQRDFLSDHLGKWVPIFSDLVSKETGSAFYRSLALATSAFVEGDLAALEGRFKVS